ncbi:MAG: carboxylesterase [Pseudomonadales bacterium]|nr:carboxylesterase [Pseudomonadales bacterium]
MKRINTLGSWLGAVALMATGWAAPALALQDDTVETSLGTIIGVTDGYGTRFMGIPYAQPPVGNLRWAAPQPITELPQPFAADTAGSSCPQAPSPFGEPSINEDCLYLNVYRPEGNFPPSRKLPVMVWIHGGAFTYGGGALYDPTPLVKEGVIVVTINYRIGALGFMAHPALTAEAGSSGNYGIMDQQMALNWVQDNIAAFGGDTENVTIFGQSAGGLSSHVHLAAPASAGLFDKAIIQSGAYLLEQPGLAEWQYLGLGVAAQAGCATDQSVDCLRNLSVTDILSNQDPGALGWLPIVDGNVLTQTVKSAITSGEFNQVPVMEGTTADEYTMFTALAFDLDPTKGPLTNDGYQQAIIDLGFPEEAAPLVALFYPPFLYQNAGAAFSAMGTDFLFACNSRSSLLALSKHVRTYGYEFADDEAPYTALPPVSFPYGASHGTEIQFLMNAFDSGELTEEQQALSEEMITFWTKFAKNGNPNAPGSFYWPQYNGLHGIMMSLQTPKSLPKLGFKIRHKCDFWTTLFSLAP